MLKVPHNPKPYSRKTKEGNHIPMHERAKAAADFLEKEIWGKPEEARDEIEWDTADYPIIRNTLGIKLTDIEMEELTAVLTTAKRNKVSGPDGIPMEVFKELQQGGRGLESYWSL